MQGRRPTAPEIFGDQVALPACYMRGGTSRALFFHKEDLPPLGTEEGYEKWSPIFLAAMGSPDANKRQLDGMGGGVSSLSKVAVISPSQRNDADVDYLFGQVGVDNATVGYWGNCGNISSAVGPFAVDEGLVAVDGNEAKVRIHNVNTGKIIVSTFPLSGTRAAVDGDYVLQGVEGSGAPVRLAFLRPGGAVTGRLLPTGRAVDTVTLEGPGEVRMSCVDAANPVVFVSGEELGLDFATGPRALADDDWLKLFEEIRIAAAVQMGLVETAAAARESMRNLPLVSAVYRPRSLTTLAGEKLMPQDMDVVTQMISAGLPHLASPLTGAMCLACAAAIAGTLVAEIAGCAVDMGRWLRLAHPSGRMEIAPVISRGDGGMVIEEVAIFRTARRLMDGRVFVSQRHYFNGAA